MQKWDKEINQATLDNEKEVLEALKKNYQDALDEINTKIAILLGRKDADMMHVIYQVEYQEALKTQIEGILDMLQANEFETISEYLTKSYEEGYMGALYSMQEQGVPLMLPLDQEQIVRAIQHDTMLSESLYDSLGKDVQKLSKQIAGEISRGISTGKMYNEIAKDISGYAGISRNKAMRIARTEGHRIQAEANYHAQVKAKSKGADVVKVWSASLDARTRSEHLKLDGQVKEINEPFKYGRYKAMHEGAFGVAHMDINCRCRAITKARWLLDAEQTKMLEDVSKMSDKQKKTIAKKLGIKPKDLEQYSGQVVPVKAKNYADFKQQYNKLWKYEGSELQEKAEARIAELEKEKKAKKGKSVGDTFVPVKTDDEALEALINKVGFTSIEDSFYKMDKQLIVDSTNQLMRLENKFGAVHSSATIHISCEQKNGMAVTSSGKFTPANQLLGFNPKYYKNKKTLLDEDYKSVKSGFAMPCALKDEEIAVYTVTHEYGHILQNIIRRDYMQSMGWEQNNPMGFYNRTAKTDKAKFKWYTDALKKVENDCYNEIVAIAQKNNKDFVLADNISRYGAVSKAEFFAEVFANSQLSEPNELGKAMNEWLKEKGLVKG